MRFREDANLARQKPNEPVALCRHHSGNGKRIVHRVRHRRRPARATASCSPPPSIWSPRLQTARQHGRLAAELAKLRRYALLIVDEVGCMPFEHDGQPFFELAATRYEHASMIPSSNLLFSRWGDVFSDHVVVAAMIDRIVRHADTAWVRRSRWWSPGMCDVVVERHLPAATVKEREVLTDEEVTELLDRLIAAPAPAGGTSPCCTRLSKQDFAHRN
jgi:hypothetical protein